VYGCLESGLYHLNIKSFGGCLDLVPKLAADEDESYSNNADREEVCSNDGADLGGDEGSVPRSVS